MLAGEQTTAALSILTKAKFSTVKVAFDVFLVLVSAAFAMVAFGNPLGDGASVVIREGTIILALFTGLCMKLTDPLVEKVFGRLLGHSK